MKNCKMCKLIIFCSLALSFSSISADPFIYNIVTPDAALSSYGSFFGTATVNLINPTIAHVTFNAAPGFLFGADKAIGWRTQTLAGFTNFSSSQLPGFTPAPLNGGGFTTVGTFGEFNFDNVTGGTFQNAYQSITIQLGKISGTWASSADVLGPNSLGNIVVGHIFVCAGGVCSAAAGSIADGFATTGVAVAAPEPATYLLFGSLLGIALFVRSKKTNKIA